MHSATIDRLPADGLLRYASAKHRQPSWIKRSIVVSCRMTKGIILFAGLLMLVTAAAALVGCLFLSNGDIAYLTSPDDLFHFLFNVRAGLKVNIVFVTLLLFFLLMNDGLLTRRWWPGGQGADA